MRTDVTIQRWIDKISEIKILREAYVSDLQNHFDNLIAPHSTSLEKEREKYQNGLQKLEETYKKDVKELQVTYEKNAKH